MAGLGFAIKPLAAVLLLLAPCCIGRGRSASAVRYLWVLLLALLIPTRAPHGISTGLA